MAINYDDFSRAFGTFVSKIDAYDHWIDELAVYEAELIATLSAQDALHLVDDVPETYEALQDSITNWINSRLKAFTDAVIVNPTLVTNNLPVGDVTGVAEVLQAIRKDMLDTSNTVKSCAITIGSPSYDLTNTGAVLLLTTSTLDGFSPPASYAVADPTYANVVSELAQDSQTVTFVCTADAESGGTARGAEQFQIVGNPANGSYHRNSEGLGEAATSCVNVAGGSLAANGSFASWTTGNPNSWTINDGVTVTDFEEDPNGLRGGSSFKLKGGNTNVDISQLIPEDELIRRKAYFLIALVKKAGTTGTIVFTLKESSTTIANFTADMATAAAGWNLYNDLFLVPDSIAADWTLRIVCDTSGCNGSPLVDDVLIVPVNYMGGFGHALVAIDAKIILQDEVSMALSNDNAGVLQTAFRRLYGMQMPSSGSPTIGDAYALRSPAMLGLSGNVGSVT
jgi:hypothetical protein